MALHSFTRNFCFVLAPKPCKISILLDFTCVSVCTEGSVNDWHITGCVRDHLALLVTWSLNYLLLYLVVFSKNKSVCVPLLNEPQHEGTANFTHPSYLVALLQSRGNSSWIKLKQWQWVRERTRWHQQHRYCCHVLLRVCTCIVAQSIICSVNFLNTMDKTHRSAGFINVSHFQHPSRIANCSRLSQTFVLYLEIIRDVFKLFKK